MTIEEFSAKWRGKRASVIGIGVSNRPLIDFLLSAGLLVTARDKKTKEEIGDAADELCELFDFNIPMRWSVAHYYQAVLNGEAHVKDVAFLTTLAGYVHYKLTGKKVLGVGDASGMFPIKNGTYDKEMLCKLNSLHRSSSRDASAPRHNRNDRNNRTPWRIFRKQRHNMGFCQSLYH